MYHLRTVSFSDQRKLPLIFNKESNQPCHYFLQYLIFYLRYKNNDKLIRDRAYTLLRFYNHLSVHLYLDDKTFSINWLRPNLQLITESFINNELHKIPNESYSYRNLILYSLNDFCKYLSRTHNIKYDPNWVSVYYVKKQITKQSSTDRNIEPSTLDLIGQLTTPGSVLNPYQEINQHRNFIIFQLLIETGIRKGELLSLTLDSYQELNQSFYLQITDSFSVGDMRFDKARVKNKQSNRTIAISKALFIAIHYYVTNERFTNGLHNLLFTSKKGQPLSKDTLYQNLEKLNDALDSIVKSYVRIKPHDFRYTFANSFLSYLIEIEKYNIDMACDELRQIMGWAINSSMPQKYAANYIHYKANEMNLKRIDQSYSFLNVNK